VSDNKQIKALGLRFARGLQMTVKTAVMFTVEHKSVERPIQQSFQLLNNLLKEVGQFTFGFVDNQIILNNLLTTETTLRQLETEFLKRGIAAVTFEPGLTLGRYKKVISLLSAPTKLIEQSGGLLGFLDQNEVEGARILPAAKNQKKDEHGDTIIESDSEAYILSKQLAEEQGPRDFLDSIDALLESGCFDPSTRSEVLSDFATRGIDGTGYGVPIGMPNLVVLREGQSVGPTTQTGPASESESGTGQGSSSHGSTGAATNSGSVGFGQQRAWDGGQSGGTPTDAEAPQNGTSVFPRASGSSSHSGEGAVQSTGSGGFGGGVRDRWSSGAGTFLELVETSVQRSLIEERGNPQKSYMSLARILRSTGADKILSYFPPERRQELTSLPPEQLAAEYIEDTAFQLAGAKLQSSDGHSQKLVIEEDVVRVLVRSLQATHMADRLAQKLTQFIQDYAVPQHLQERIREELRWSSLGSVKKYDRLMSLKHYSSLEFRRVIELLKELVKLREMDRATALASHYFEFLDDQSAQIDVTELSRAPELIRSIPLAHAGFAGKTAERLGQTLFREDLSEFIHAQAASAITVLAQSVAAFEDFQDVLAIGVSLETSLNRDPEKHKKCCGTGLSRILPTAAIERIVELFLLQRSDAAWGKTAGALLRFAAPASVECVFNHLILERDARNRMALVRLIGQLGTASIEVAYKYLKDDRWYVVRNICGVLAELKDPDLAEHIAPALEHPDSRVQQAALKALVRSRTVRAAPVLAAALSKMSPKVLDEALDELMFLRHVKTVPGLEEFVIAGNGGLTVSKKVIQVLGSIDDDEALQALARLFRREELDARIRRMALEGLCKTQSPVAVEILQELAATRGPLREEIRAELKKAAAAE
jgi:HEAT repeat protein